MAIWSDNREDILFEIGGIALLGFSLYVLISLLSYTPHDPSFNAIDNLSGGVRNWGGEVGAYGADILLTYIGITSYTIPFLLFILSVELMVKKRLNMAPLRPFFFLLLIITLSGLISIIMGRVGLFGVELESGGIVGKVLNLLLIRYFNRAGAILILSICFLIFGVLTTGLSIVRLVSITGGIVTHIFNSIWTSVIVYLERKRRGKELTRKKMVRRKDKPKISTSPPKEKTVKEEPVQESFDFLEPEGVFHLPPISLLDSYATREKGIDESSLIMNSRILEKKLTDFDVRGKVTEVHPGPVITLYEFEPAPGIKINRIVNLADDLALALKAMSIRIIAPIPGKSVVGIEIPNKEREKVGLREIIGSEAYKKSTSPLSLVLGKDISGTPFVTDLTKMPHLLIAGSTGAGKSVSLNVMILSILYRATPDMVRFVMIDPKRLELSTYNSIPHLLLPVITDVKRATSTLKGILHEMEERYRLMAETGVKNIAQYNKRMERKGEKRFPYIVVVIDEMADLMMTTPKEFEDVIIRLAQMARAAGIHLIIATQRPSVDVVTGLIKANFPTRISFQVPSRTDSRTILDTGGAENLLGEGDMLFLPPGTSKVQRVHGAYVSEMEIKRVVEFLKKQGEPAYQDDLIMDDSDSDEVGEGFEDEKYDEAVSLVLNSGQASISYIQRRLRIGYNRAARMIERMEREGIVGPADGSKPREVLRGQ